MKGRSCLVTLEVTWATIWLKSSGGNCKVAAEEVGMPVGGSEVAARVPAGATSPLDARGAAVVVVVLTGGAPPGALWPELARDRRGGDTTRASNAWEEGRFWRCQRRGGI